MNIIFQIISWAAFSFVAMILLSLFIASFYIDEPPKWDKFGDY